MARRNYGPSLIPVPRRSFVTVGLRALPTQWRLLRSRREQDGPVTPAKAASVLLALSTPWLATRRAWATITGNAYRPRDGDALIHLVPLCGPDRPKRVAKLATAALAPVVAFGFWVAGARGLATTEYAIANALDLTRAVTGLNRTFDTIFALPGSAVWVTAAAPTAFNATGFRWVSANRRSLKKSQEPIWEVRAIDASSRTELAHAFDVVATVAQSRDARLVAEAPSRADYDALLSCGFGFLPSPRPKFEAYATMEHGRRHREGTLCDDPEDVFPVNPPDAGRDGSSPEESGLDSQQGQGRVPISADHFELVSLAREI